MFHSKEYEEGKMIYNSGVCVKRFICNEFEADYYETFEKIIKLQYHSEQNIIFFLFKCYWYETTDRGVIIDTHHSLIKINSKLRLCNVVDIIVFTKQC